MCGITFVHRIDGLPANKSILKRYHKQKSRGSEGFGYIAISKNKLKSFKRASLESQIKTFIDKETSETILFHHRLPTSTPNFMESAHPIKVSSIDLKYDYYLVHNGIISNADELKEKHEALGFVYNTEITQKYLTSGNTYKEMCFNDSEALAIEVAIALDKGEMKIESKGSIAFIVAKVNKSSNNIDSIYYARNYGSPLKFSQTGNLISIGSESEGNIVPIDILHRLDLKTNEVTKEYFNIPSYGYGGSYGYNTGANYGAGDGYYDTYGIWHNIVKNDGYGTTYGDDDDWEYEIPATKQLPTIGYNDPTIETYEDIEDMKERYNEVDFEITTLNVQLDNMEANNDGTPEKENTIIEVEALIHDLVDERNQLDRMIMQLSLCQDDE